MFQTSQPVNFNQMSYLAAMTMSWSTVDRFEYLMFFSHLLAFLSPGIGYKSAVFQACKICVCPSINQNNHIWLIECINNARWWKCNQMQKKCPIFCPFCF